MADTVALISIERVVNDFLLTNKKSTEDYITYLANACNCVQDFSLYHGNVVTTAKVAISALKLIEMPSDMIGFVDICLPFDGAWWSMTEKKEIVNTTTFTGVTEGRDSTVGEGVEIKHAMTSGYGARGAVNAYNYTIDWKARRIYLDGIDTGDAVLFYVSSGIDASSDTTVSALLIPVINAYLLWRETIWIPQLARYYDIRERDYEKEVLKARHFINSLSYQQLRDLLLSESTQGAKR